jgi:hypothetical protein
MIICSSVHCIRPCRGRVPHISDLISAKPAVQLRGINDSRADLESIANFSYLVIHSQRRFKEVEAGLLINREHKADSPLVPQATLAPYSLPSENPIVVPKIRTSPCPMYGPITRKAPRMRCLKMSIR